LDRALDAGLTIAEAFVCRELLIDEQSRQLARRLETAGSDIFHVAARVFEKLAFGARAEGVVGVAATPRHALADVRLSDCPLVAVLEACEKPGNLGAVLRSADAAGVSAVIAADSRTDVFNPNAIRSSLGTIFSMPLAAGSSSEALSWLRVHELAVIATRVDATLDYTAVDFTRPTAVVLGSEAAGLSAAWQASDVTAVRLPMLGVADSLNISAAAAVLFYEALRQRRAARGEV
jgi:TrmH family RNA methyltransferase